MACLPIGRCRIIDGLPPNRPFGGQRHGRRRCATPTHHNTPKNSHRWCNIRYTLVSVHSRFALRLTSPLPRQRPLTGLFHSTLTTYFNIRHAFHEFGRNRTNRDNENSSNQIFQLLPFLKKPSNQILSSSFPTITLLQPQSISPNRMVSSFFCIVLFSISFLLGV